MGIDDHLSVSLDHRRHVLIVDHRPIRVSNGPRAPDRLCPADSLTAHYTMALYWSHVPNPYNVNALT